MDLKHFKRKKILLISVTLLFIAIFGEASRNPAFASNSKNSISKINWKSRVIFNRSYLVNETNHRGMRPFVKKKPRIYQHTLNVLMPDGSVRNIRFSLIQPRLSHRGNFLPELLLNFKHYEEINDRKMGEIEYSRFSQWIQQIISHPQTRSLTFLTGSFLGANMFNLNIDLPKGSDLVVFNYGNHGQLNVKGDGRVFFMPEIIDIGGRVETSSIFTIAPDREPVILEASYMKSNNSLLEKFFFGDVFSDETMQSIQEKVQNYCQSDVKDSSLLSGIIPEDFTLYDNGYVGSNLDGYYRRIIVSCGDMEIQSISDAIVLCDGEVSVDRIKESVVVARKIKGLYRSTISLLNAASVYPSKDVKFKFHRNRPGTRLMDLKNSDLPSHHKEIYFFDTKN